MNQKPKNLRFQFKGGGDTRLDKFLAEQTVIGSRAHARALIAEGLVLINKKRCRISSRILFSGAVVEVQAAPGAAPASERQEGLHDFDLERILFEDAHLVAVDKPWGLPAQATRDPRRDHLYAALRRALAKRDRTSPDHYYLTLQHRLDRDTSGVMVFTKSKKLNKPITDAFREQKAKKKYIAIVEGTFPKESRELKDFLSEKPRRDGAHFVVTKGGKMAITRVRCLATASKDGEAISLVLAEPQTGRSHQIRVQLAQQGFPILGDRLYGAKIREAGRCRLHALELKVLEWTFQAPAPEDFVALFPKALGNIGQLLADA